MSQEQLCGLQESVKKLAEGCPDVLLDTYTAHVLPAAVMVLLENSRFGEFDNVLAQLSTASRTVDKDLRLTASRCFVEVAKSLAVTKYKNRERLEKMIPGLQTIAGSPVYLDRNRSVAKSILEKMESMQSAGTQSSPAGRPTPQDHLAMKEEKIFLLANAGETKTAKKQLYDLVVSCARKKDFANAERLCERIYDIDPMALKEIIQSSEIIELEKNKTLCHDKQITWAKLCAILKNNEFTNLYHSMEGKTFKPEETIVIQGATNEELYFIDCGSVRVSYMCGDKEFFLKNLDSGDIAGENFFHASVWTFSLTTVKTSRILILKRDKLSELDRKHPGIKSKLRDYFHRTNDIHKMLQAKGMDRRVHERYKFVCPVQLQVLDEKDNVLSSFKGETEDISQWGLSFVVRIAGKENSRLLLGRKIQINMPVKFTEDKILLHGTVIGIKPYDLIARDFSVHVRFAQELDRRFIQAIMGEYHIQIKKEAGNC